MGSEPRHVVHRLHPALASVLGRTQGTAIGQALADRVIEAGAARAFDTGVDRTAALAAFRWFLERSAGEGMPLTSAGYLKPADVEAAAAVLPAMEEWPGSVRREINAHPVHDLREHMRESGLLRKYKGTLRSSRLGAACLTDVDALWKHLADGLIVGGELVDTDTSVLLLVHLATTDGPIDRATIASTLTDLGWMHRSGDPFSEWDVYPVWNFQWEVLGNVGDPANAGAIGRVASDAAKALIRDALMQERRDNDR